LFWPRRFINTRLRGIVPQIRWKIMKKRNALCYRAKLHRATSTFADAKKVGSGIGQLIVSANLCGRRNNLQTPRGHHYRAEQGLLVRADFMRRRQQRAKSTTGRNLSSASSCRCRYVRVDQLQISFHVVVG